jgi:flagellar basal-body rod modification protein FlgD
MATTTSSTSGVSTSTPIATSLDPRVQANLDQLKVRSTKQQLNADDFLKLLTVQLQNQDPLKPMEDAQFMGQMAQFAALEQTRDLNTSFANFAKQQAVATAAQYIGMQVTLRASNGTQVVGPVSSVNLTADGPKVVVNGTAYAYDSVISVQMQGAPVATPTAPSQTTPTPSN